MIEFIKQYFVHEDHRGTIKGLINKGNWGEINFISSYANSIRGNHYHKDTIELFIISDGEIEVTLQEVKNNKLIGAVETTKVYTGNVFLVTPMINHTFKIIKNSHWFNILSKPLEQDIFTLEK